MDQIQLIWLVLLILIFVVGVLVGRVFFQRPGSSGTGDEPGVAER